ncbi:outer membrane lipoprotein carrier protein LolA [Geotalea sp. SG265]|uniref:LolA family protein n=1 Tax=Geotalea sp. SG265 TaxID=2922867 RepID=UPI001FB022EC|nr:outer membrane lipoprotein carrier protein LolA [Geotalea sp. SG265]
MKKLLLMILLVVISMVTSAHAAPNKAVEALEVLRHGFSAMTDFSAEIVQEKQMAMMKRKMVSKGIVRFRKPGTFYMELLPPYGSRLLLRDNVLTMRLPEQGVADRIVLPPEESLDKWFAYLAKPVTKLPDGMELRAERQGSGWNLQLFPKGKGGVKELAISFDGDGKIKRLTIQERNGDNTVIKFANMRRNAGLKDKDFQLN